MLLASLRRPQAASLSILVVRASITFVTVSRLAARTSCALRHDFQPFRRYAQSIFMFRPPVCFFLAVVPLLFRTHAEIDRNVQADVLNILILPWFAGMVT
jgi:hypothetical protein